MDTRIYLEILEELRAGNSLALAILVKKAGSAPRDMGAKMVVTADGRLLGTLGGGCVEAEVYSVCKSCLDAGKYRMLEFSLNLDQAAEEGLVCGGKIWVSVIPLTPLHIPFWEKVVASIHNVQTNFLTLVVQSTDKQDVSEPPEGELLLRRSDGTGVSCFSGNPTVDSQWAQFVVPVSSDAQAPGPGDDAIPFLNTSADIWIYHEPLRLAPDLVLFGAGHISQYLARMARDLGYRITVVDDRPFFANQERFPDAHRVLVAEFTDCWNHLSPGPWTYIIIVTRGHKHDEIVLRKALQVPHRYIGMIGSRHKVATMVGRIKEEGLNDDALKHVYSPIGLDIGAETPAEIAVSILAELTTVRNQGHRPGFSYPHLNRID